MNQVYSISTEDYQPISHGDTYLYENYQRIIAFLKNNLDSEITTHFSKPILSNDFINWYSVYSSPMKGLEAFSNDYQENVEEKYVNLLFKIDQLKKKLLSSNDPDKEVWANLLNAVFKTEDNLLISNGSDWVLIWGWKFRNKLNFHLPMFIDSDPEVLDSIQNKNDLSESNEDEIETIAENPKINNPDLKNISTNNKNIDIEQDAPVLTNRKLSFWERVRRFFRWITYRFWGLFVLIMFILLLLCICKQCSSSKIESYNQNELEKIEERIRNRCDDVNTIID